MPVPFKASSTREEIKAAVGDGGAVNGVSNDEDSEAVTRGDHDSKGKFAIGNRAQTSNKGVVAMIKAQTHDYRDLIEFLLKASRGETFGKHVPTFKERLDATNSLLDRSIGKPTQQVLHTGDDIAKELLATRQEALRLQKAEATRKAEARAAPVDAPETGQVSSLQAMRDKAG